MDKNNLLTSWYPDFVGISYAEDDEGVLLCPYFFERGKAIFVSEKIKEWNENFINVTFIKTKNHEYEFVCYERLQASKNQRSFGLYRSSMNQNGGFKEAKHSFQKNPRLQILFVKNPKSFDERELIGSPLKIKKVEIISEEDLIYRKMPSKMDLDYPYYTENIAHLLLTKRI